MINFSKMKRDCFWDYNFSDEEIRKLANSDDIRERSFLFQKILLNSTNLFGDLKIFKRELLFDLIKEYEVPVFNHNHAFKRKNMAEVYFLNKPLLVDELKWVV